MEKRVGMVKNKTQIIFRYFLNRLLAWVELSLERRVKNFPLYA